MPATAIARKHAKRLLPSVLVVDDEPDLVQMLRDVVGSKVECRILSATDIDEARRILANEPIQLLVTDLHLPGGDGMTLLPVLRARQSNVHAIVITGRPTVNGAISAIRAGATDFVPKPFSAQQIVERVEKALAAQHETAKSEKRLDRLRNAVRRLNTLRRLVTRKVDLLCNDLVSAYGELSRQFDDVRHQEAFRKLLSEATDLEQLLCHAMDWLLRNTGYSNVAIWLASEEQGYQLGAYMKYTIPGEAALTEAMRDGILPMVTRNGFVHLSAEQAQHQLTPVELAQMPDQTVLAVNCTYLGESLAALVLFRDDRSPFSDEDISVIKSISGIFATSLARMVRQSDDSVDSEGGGLLEDEDPERRKGKGGGDADWWKRGEKPPF